MAVAFQAVGALAAVTAPTFPLTVVAPVLAVDDIMIAVLFDRNIDSPPSNGFNPITPPVGWTLFAEGENPSGPTFTIFWKRAVGGDSEASFIFTRTIAADLFCGVISAWRGCVTTGSPIDATAPSTSLNAISDSVSYASFDPTETNAFVVAVGMYNQDGTTAGAIAGTDPTFTNQWDLETAVGSDGSIFGYSGASSGVATGARSNTTSSPIDAVSWGCLFGLVAASEGIPNSLMMTGVGT